MSSRGPTEVWQCRCATFAFALTAVLTGVRAAWLGSSLAVAGSLPCRALRPWARRTRAARPVTRRPALGDLAGTRLESLAQVTTLSIDTGDLDVIAEYVGTGFITDATTNPLFVSQAGLSGNARYVAIVDEAIAFVKEKGAHMGKEDQVNLAIDRVAVNLGKEIASLVSGYVSTEVDIRESWDVEASVSRARRIISMYEELGVPRSRILIKLAATWEGIKAAEILEKEGITCNLTLVFGFTQAVACGQAGVRLISPFPGRILDWHKANGGKPTYEPEEDPGVVAVKRMYAYFKKFGHEGTICMPASWRPSRGKGFETDEVVALAGVDRMTIPPALLEGLAVSKDPLPRRLSPEAAAAGCADNEVCSGAMTEKDFRIMLNMDLCATTKLAEGINAFVYETMKLRTALISKL